MSARRASGGLRQGQGRIMASLCERRSRTPSDGKGIWVPRHEACRPPSCPVPASEARRHAEARSRYVLPSELQVGRDPDGAVAPLWGEGEEKGGESPGGSRGRGGKGAAEGGGTERRRAASAANGGGARGPQSSEAQPSAAADRRAERERPRSEGAQGGGERAWVEERRRPRDRGRRAPESLASVPLDAVRVSPVGRFHGRPATSSAHWRKGPERPVAADGAQWSRAERGLSPLFLRLRAGGAEGEAGANGGPARFVRPCPEASRSERHCAGPLWAAPGAERRGQPGPAQQRATGPEGCPVQGQGNKHEA